MQGDVTMSIEDALRIGLELHQNGHLQEAEHAYTQILKAWPECPDALHYMGVVSHQLGTRNDAVDYIKRSLAIDPDQPNAWSNLGNVLKEEGRLDEAEAAYRNVIDLAPEHTETLNNLGVLLKNRNALDEAEVCFRKALELKPDYGDACHNYANLLRTQKRYEEAEYFFRKAIRYMPQHAKAYEHLAKSLHEAGKRDEALEVLQEWLHFSPDHPVPKHILASFQETAAPDRAADDYVRQVFDGFAATFDTLLLNNLKYQAPQLIGETLRRLLPEPERQYQVLDAGCGTGLCGKEVRPYANKLVGVDLSSGMLKRARKLSLYDELVEAELTQFLEDHVGKYDLIVSADTLVYFGDLERVFRAAYQALRPHGYLAFTLEHADEKDAPAGQRINPHGRYSHTRGYVTGTLEKAGLIVQILNDVHLRMERDVPVPGMLVIATSPDSP